jgi:hypothetical protein
MDTYKIPVKEQGAPDTDAVPVARPAELPAGILCRTLMDISRAFPAEPPEIAPLAIAFSTTSSLNVLTYGTGKNDYVRYVHGNVPFGEILTHLPAAQAYHIAAKSPTARRRLKQELRSLGKAPENLKAMTLEGRVFLF